MLKKNSLNMGGIDSALFYKSHESFINDATKIESVFEEKIEDGIDIEMHNSIIFDEKMD